LPPPHVTLGIWLGCWVAGSRLVGWRLETGDWRLETGDWRLEQADWGAIGVGVGVGIGIGTVS